MISVQNIDVVKNVSTSTMTFTLSNGIEQVETQCCKQLSISNACRYANMAKTFTRSKCNLLQ